MGIFQQTMNIYIPLWRRLRNMGHMTLAPSLPPSLSLPITASAAADRKRIRNDGRQSIPETEYGGAGRHQHVLGFPGIRRTSQYAAVFTGFYPRKGRVHVE